MWADLEKIIKEKGSIVIDAGNDMRTEAYRIHYGMDMISGVCVSGWIVERIYYCAEYQGEQYDIEACVASLEQAYAMVIVALTK